MRPAAKLTRREKLTRRAKLTLTLGNVLELKLTWTRLPDQLGVNQLELFMAPKAAVKIADCGVAQLLAPRTRSNAVFFLTEMVLDTRRY